MTRIAEGAAVAAGRSPLAAVGRVLGEMGGSGFELQPVFDRISEEAASLCRADQAFLFLRDGDLFHFAAAWGGRPEHWAHEREHPNPIDRESIVGRVALADGPVQIEDVPADPDYTSSAHTVGGVRTLLGVPIRTDEGVVGAFGLGRSRVEPFSADEIDLVSLFADQASIAIRLARLLGEAREAAEREAAVASVLETLARSSFDLEAVLQSIIDSTVRLIGADEGNIVKEEDGAFQQAVFTAGVPPSFREIIGGRSFKAERGSVMGRSLMELGPVQIVDVLADAEYELQEAQKEAGFRSIIGIPLMTEGAPVGVMSVWRTRVEAFTEAEIRLLVTFAEQAAVALRLARVLEETHEALERETAIAHVLASIARSSFDLQRVLDTVTESAARLTHANSGNLALVQEGEYRIAAGYGERSRELARAFETARITLDRGSMAGRVTLAQGPVQIPDVLSDPEYRMLDMQEVAGFRTLLGVPLMRDGEVRGVLMMQRTEVRPFTDQEVAVITTFADQAALAIANVELYETVERQRAALAGFAPHVAGPAFIAGGRDAARRASARDLGPVLRHARVHRLRRDGRARGAVQRPSRIPRRGRPHRPGQRRHGGAFRRGRVHDLLQRPDPRGRSPHWPPRAPPWPCTSGSRELAEGWRRRGYDLGLGIGVSVGYATLGRIGFEGRYDYAGVGAVTNMAARLSSAAAAGETLLSQRAYAAVEGRVDAEPTDELNLKGFSHAVIAFRVTGIRGDVSS